VPVRLSASVSSLRMSWELRGAVSDQPRIVLIEKRVKAEFASPAISHQGPCLNDGLEAPLGALASRTICVVAMKHQEGTLSFQIGNACIKRSNERIHEDLLCDGKGMVLMQDVHNSVAILGLIAEAACFEKSAA
jgi:hypothetical protein